MDWNSVDIIVLCEMPSEASRLLTFFKARLRYMTSWYQYKERTCYHIHNGIITYCFFEYFEISTKITTFQDFYKKHKDEFIHGISNELTSVKRYENLKDFMHNSRLAFHRLIRYNY